MNEIAKVLEPKEKVIWDGKPKYVPYMISMFFGGLIFGLLLGALAYYFLKSVLAGVVVGIIIFIVAFFFGNLSYKATHYALTNKRVIFQSGIIGRDFRSVNYDDIKNASAKVGLIGVIFHVGDINIFTGEITSTGGKNQQIAPKYDTIQAVDKPYDVLRLLQKNLSQREEKLYR